MSAIFRFETVTIFGGRGAVATLLARTLREAGARVLTLVDLHTEGAALAGTVAIQGDARHPSAEILRAVGTSDLVILAVPEAIAAEAAQPIVRAMRSNALLVETLSVKHEFAAAVARIASGPELLGINPMFAPSLGFTGRSVVAVPYRAGPHEAAFIELIRAQGAEVVSMQADSHDRACATLQAATHASILAFGTALRSSGYDLPTVEAIMPPPHRTLLALLARMLSADAEVYRDIQSANPHAAQARAQLIASLGELDELVKSGDSAQFRGMFEDLRRLFIDSHTDYADLCARLFQLR